MGAAGNRDRERRKTRMIPAREFAEEILM